MSDEDEVFSGQKEKDEGGRPPHVPTEQNRKTVKMMLAAGLKQAQVCMVLDISDRTLRKYYSREIECAEPEMFAVVGQSLMLQAIGGPERDWKQANTSAAIFIAKTRMGWKEPAQDVNLRGAVGTYDLSKLDDDGLRRLKEIIGAIAVDGGDRRGDRET